MEVKEHDGRTCAPTKTLHNEVTRKCDTTPACRKNFLRGCFKEK